MIVKRVDPKDEESPMGMTIEITLAPGEAFFLYEIITAVTGTVSADAYGENADVEASDDPLTYLGRKLRSIIYDDFMGHTDAEND